MIPDTVRSTVEKFAAKHGLPSNISDDERRSWILRLAQTVSFYHKDREYGNKARTPENPISGDVIASRTPFEAMDVLTGDPTDRTKSKLQWLEVNPVGQAFIPVTPYDWLSDVPGAPSTPDLHDPVALEEAIRGIWEMMESSLKELKSISEALDGISLRLRDVAMADRQEKLCDITDTRIQNARTMIEEQMKTGIEAIRQDIARKRFSLF